MYSLKNYTKELLSRVGTARYLEITPININGWQPVVNRCHDNVVHLCDLDNSYTQIYGFLFSNMSLFGYVSFIFHSVAKDKNGNLIDITPTTARKKYPFLECGIHDDAYRELMYDYGPELQVQVSIT